MAKVVEKDTDIMELKEEIVRLTTELNEAKAFERHFNEGMKAGSDIKAFMAGMIEAGLDEAFVKELVLRGIKQ